MGFTLEMTREASDALQQLPIELQELTFDHFDALASRRSFKELSETLGRNVLPDTDIASDFTAQIDNRQVIVFVTLQFLSARQVLLVEDIHPLWSASP